MLDVDDINDINDVNDIRFGTNPYKASPQNVSEWDFVYLRRISTLSGVVGLQNGVVLCFQMNSWLDSSRGCERCCYPPGAQQPHKWLKSNRITFSREHLVCDGHNKDEMMTCLWTYQECLIPGARPLSSAVFFIVISSVISFKQRTNPSGFMFVVDPICKFSPFSKWMSCSRWLSI